MSRTITLLSVLSLLRTAVKELVAFAVRYSGATALVRETVARRRVGILAYHDPTPTLFERHLKYVSRRYSLVTLEDLVRALESGEWSALPRCALVLTFDDGHSVIRELAPLFEKYAVRPTVYLCSEPVLGNGQFWFRERGVDPEPLKTLPNRERLQVLDRVRAMSSDPHDLSKRHALEASEVAGLVMAGIVDFQSHSVSHPILPLCSAAESEKEIRQSRLDIEGLTGKRCDHFSFPNGDYSPREIELLKRAAYRSGRTTEIGWNGPRTDPFRLRIIGMPDVASVNVLAAHLTGILFFKRLVTGRIAQRED